jgi:putative ABC transport system permease protein
MAALGHDIRYAIQRMKRTPGFTGAAVGILALGMGLNSAVLSLAHALFLKRLPVDQAERVVMVDQTHAGRTETWFGLSYPDYLYYRQHARVFDDIAAHYPTSPLQIATAEAGFPVMGAVVTASYFTLLRLQPEFGRFFSAEEDQVPGRNPVVVISHDLWQNKFGADRRILGTTVHVNGTPFTVIGVAPEGFRGVVRGVPRTDVWMPTAMFNVGYRYCDAFARGCPVVQLIGRLRRNTQIEEAQAQLTVLARQLEAAFPETNKGHGIFVRPARGVRIEEQLENAPVVVLLAVAAALVLLTAAANVAALMLARALRRRKDVAIQLALGAGRARLVRQVLVEAVLLALAGSAAGFIVAVWSTDILRAFFGVGYDGTPLNVEFGLEPRIVAAGFAIALLVGIATGLGPAFLTTRSAPAPALKESTGGGAPRRVTLRDGLVALQLAVSVLLLASSGLLVRSFIMVRRGPGFDPASVVMLRLRPSLIDYSLDRSWAFQREVIRRLEALPGVVAASPAGVPPLPGWTTASEKIQLGPSMGDTARAFRTATTPVGPRYFETLGVSLVEGREFDDRDRPDGPRVTIVNQTLARHFWPNGGALGSTVTIEGDQFEVVGVVQDLQFVSALQSPEPVAYLDFWQQSRTENWSKDSRTHVGVRGNAAALLPEIRRVIAAVDPYVPLADASTLDAALSYALSNVRWTRTLLLTFGALALVLGSLGLYASLAFAVSQRTREIAIRIALGAARVDVAKLVLNRGAAIVAAGLVAGLAAATSAGPFLSSMLYGVSPRDPLALLAGPSILIAVA